MSKIKIAKIAGMKLADVVKKLKKRKYAKDSKKNVERATGVKMNKSVKAYNIRAKDAETKIIPVKRQSQKGSTFQIHRVRTKMGRAAAQSEERGKLPSPLPTLERLFRKDVQRGKLDDYRLTKRYLKNKLTDVAKKKYIGGMMKNKMLTGGQAKLDKNKNNRIDAEDFAMLRKEKSKKKPMKAALGAMALGAIGAKILKDRKKKASKMSGVGGAAGSGLIPGMSVADIIQKKLKRSKGGGADSGIAGEHRSRMGVALNKVRRTARLLRDKDRLTEKDIEKAKEIIKNKKMGGGMMMKPMGYKAGKSVKVKCKIGRNKPTKMY